MVYPCQPIEGEGTIFLTGIITGAGDERLNVSGLATIPYKGPLRRGARRRGAEQRN